LIENVNAEGVEAIRDNDDNNDDNENVEMLFNSPINEESTESIKELNCNKASAWDLVPQHFKYGVNVSLPYIRKYFNRLFTNAEFPSRWAKSIILPVYKKGDKSNAGNYRGISLLKVFSKIYICVLTKRVTFFTDAYWQKNECQAGFRSGYSTIDNAFILYSIVCKYMVLKGRYRYVAFVDFQKAFDSVDITFCMKS